MKLSKLIVVLFVVASMISCKSDDDSGTEFAYSKANLEGTYDLTYYTSEETETTTVNGFEIITTTTQVGSVFDFDVVFRADGIAVSNGTYLVDETVVQGSNSTSNSEIVDVDNSEVSYTVSAGTSTLTLAGDSYEVTSFNETSMTITFDEVTTNSDGDTTVYTEELRFSRR